MASTPNEKLVSEIKKIKPPESEVWRYFEDRADRIREKIWTVGTWLLGILSAILALPFVSGMIAVDGTQTFEIKTKLPVTAICVFGLLFCGYSGRVWWDMKNHLWDNFDRANIARGKPAGSKVIARELLTDMFPLLVLLHFIAFILVFLQARFS